ncbi:MAG: hypothetical protein KDB53_12440 [Planctomycetes bacterium]|nr:hypothetical protein [Planctomycetota bacterium]
MSYLPGDTSGGGIFNPANVLGGPTGLGLPAGSQSVLTLGTQGSLTLGFPVVITDGPGADFSVFENAFFNAPALNMAFAEVAFVEVSTNGLDFVRFPSCYVGPPGPTGPFALFSPGRHRGLAGCLPVLAHVPSGFGDPFDPVVSGGDAFDLADLDGMPLVQSGIVDLSAIHFVRLVDVEAGVDVDANGQLIEDSGGPGSADIDAVSVIHAAGSSFAGHPQTQMAYDAAGFLWVSFEDGDGLGDLDAASFRCSFNVQLLPAQNFLAFFQAISVTSDRIAFRSLVPVQGQGVFGVLAVSIGDLSTARRSAVQFKIQG